MEGRQTKGTRLAWEWEEHVQSGEDRRAWRSRGGKQSLEGVWREGLAQRL